METLVPILCFGFVAAWLALAISVASRTNALFRSFCSAYPDEARARIPEAFTGMRHPRKALFFFSSESRVILEGKKDEVLLAERARVIRLGTAFLCLHFGAMLVLATAFLILSR